MLDFGADPGARRVGPGARFRKWLAPRLLEMNLGLETVAGNDRLVALGAIGGVRPNLGGVVVPVQQGAEVLAIKAQRVGRYPRVWGTH